MIELVTASRAADREAFLKTPLGQSSRRLQDGQQLQVRATLNNRRGLPEIYNAAIELDDADADAILVFVHDDLWLDDCFLRQRLNEGLKRFDVLGLAGNRRCPPQHVSWAFKNAEREWDREYISGAVAHGPQPCGRVSQYGPLPAACELLDGVFLAARRGALREANVRFDTAFDFHFYDLDFCRSARAAGLTLGTWPIAVTHCSGGAFGSEAWQQGLAAYQSKWQAAASAKTLEAES